MDMSDLSVSDVERMKAGRDIEGLIRALKEQDQDVRCRAAKALGETQDTGAVQPLTQALDDRLYIVREQAAEALANIGGPALGSLIQALKHECRGVRDRAARALGELGDGRGVEPLVEALKDKDGWAHFMLTVLDSLERLGAAAMAPLVGALRDEDSTVRWNAAAVLERQGWEPQNDAEKLDYLVATKKWTELVALGEPGLKPVIQALNDESHFVRCEAVDALGKTGDARVAEPLIRALKDRDWRVRLRVVNAIGKMQMVEPLIRALKDEDGSVRGNAARILGSIGDRRALEPLTQARDDREEYVVDRVQEALEKLRG